MMKWKTTSKDINFDLGPDRYVWGVPHPDIIALSERTTIRGTWLNLAAGDGRYNDLLLDRCESVVAFDMDEKSLQRLIERVQPPNRSKIQPQVGDITAPLPFESNRFDGCLCTGVLHLLEATTVRQVFAEVFRVLRPESCMIMDFAVDIQRELPDGSMYLVDGEPRYSLDDGQRLLDDVFTGVDHETRTSTVPDFPVENFDMTYVFRCNVLSLLARFGASTDEET